MSTDADVAEQVPIKIEVEIDEDAEVTEINEIMPDDTGPVGQSDVDDGDNDESNDNTDENEKTPLVVSDTKALEQHMPAHLKSRLLKYEGDEQIREYVKLACDLCASDELFATFRDLQAHFTNEHQTRGYVICCDRKIYRKDRILTHITNHVNPDAFKYEF